MAAVEPNESYWEAALARKPALRLFRSIPELLASGLAPRLASICTPDRFHLENLKELMATVDGFFLEKPLSLPDDTEKAAQLVDRLKAGKKAVFVNYYKRDEPAITRIQESIAAQKETIRYLECKYSGPFPAVGSHALDLLNFLCPVAKVTGSQRHAHTEGDGWSALLACGNGASSHLAYTGPRHDLIFELEVVTDHHRYTASDNLAALTVAALSPSTRYKNYREYVPAAPITGMVNDGRFVHALASLYQDLHSGSPNYTNLDQALRTQLLMAEIHG